MKKPTYQRGSALLLAVVIIALVGTVGFGLIRIALLQGRIAGSTSAAIQAYHAAETGLEYALLQYRVDKDRAIAETTIRMNDNQSFKVALTNEATQLGSDGCFGSDEDTYDEWVECDNDPANPLTHIEPNSSLTFQTSDLNATPDAIVVRAAPADNDGNYVNIQDGADGGVLQIQFYFRDANGKESLTHQKVMKLSEASEANLVQPGGRTMLPGFNFNKISLLYLHDDDQPLAIMLKIKRGTEELSFDTGVTTIGVTGIAPGAQRRMAARIDRRTDRVLGIFDYALNARSVSTAP